MIRPLVRVRSGVQSSPAAPVKSLGNPKAFSQKSGYGQCSRWRITYRELLKNIPIVGWAEAGQNERKVRSLFSRVVSWVFPFFAVAFFLSEYAALFGEHPFVALPLAPVVALVLYVSTSILAGGEL
jgi:hypothetical protein